MADYIEATQRLPVHELGSVSSCTAAAEELGSNRSRRSRGETGRRDQRREEVRRREQQKGDRKGEWRRRKKKRREEEERL